MHLMHLMHTCTHAPMHSHIFALHMAYARPRCHGRASSHICAGTCFCALVCSVVLLRVLGPCADACADVCSGAYVLAYVRRAHAHTQTHTCADVLAVCCDGDVTCRLAAEKDHVACPMLTFVGLCVAQWILTIEHQQPGAPAARSTNSQEHQLRRPRAGAPTARSTNSQEHQQQQQQ